MAWRIGVVAAGVVCVALGGCRGAGQGEGDREEFGMEVVTPATDAERAALIDRVKALAGTWAMTGADDGMTGEAEFVVSSNGSVVREIMFKGTPHEMTNMYTMDGDELTVVHYCAVGNQPEMEADLEDATGNQIRFELDEVDNFAGGDQTYMGGLTLVFVDANTLEQRWTHFVRGKAEPEMTITYKRK
jgi:hypothetical protein